MRAAVLSAALVALQATVVSAAGYPPAYSPSPPGAPPAVPNLTVPSSPSASPAPGSFSTPSRNPFASPSSAGAADPGIGAMNSQNLRTDPLGPSTPSAAAPAAESGPPDIVILKTASVSDASPGEVIVYTLSISNTGGTAGNVSIVDDFDEDFMSIADPGGGVLSVGKLSWRLAGLSSADGTRTISYRARIAGEVPPGSHRVVNQVVASVPGDVHEADNVARVTVTLAGGVAAAAMTGPGGAPSQLPRTGLALDWLLALSAASVLAGALVLRAASRLS